MTELHKLLAVEKTRKNLAEKIKTKTYQAAQRSALFAGLTQTYAPFDDTGETLPSEETLPQLRGETLLDEFRVAQASLMDLVATKDEGNTKARASVRVGTQVVLADVPVTTLLFLEKQLTDLRTMVTALPTLDPTYRWSFDPDTNLYRSEPEQRNRTKKIPRVLTKAAATDKHPAQVEVFHEDVAVGRYTTTRFSSALPAATVKTYLDRVEALLEAVKVAREEANTQDQQEVTIGRDVLGYVLAPVEG